MECSASFMTRPIFAHSSRGFTLLEALIYFALMSTIVVGAIASVYPILSNTGRSSMAVLRDLESAFVFQKVSYLMNGASAMSVPAPDRLVFTVSGVPNEMTVSGGIVTLSINGGTPIPLTSSRVQITNLVFTKVSGAGGAPDTLTVNFDVNGVPQGPYTRYARF